MRSRLIWVGIAIVTAVLIYEWVTFYSFVDQDPWSVLIDPFVFFGPVFAIGLGYAAVAGERSSGRIRMTLGSGGTRGDLVIGKIISRMAALLVVLWIPLIIAAITLLVVWQPADATLIGLVGAIFVTTLTTTAWLGIAIGASCAASTELRSLSISAILMLIFLYSWESVMRVFSFFIAGSMDLGLDPTTDLVDLVDPTWLAYATRLNPLQTFEAAQWYVPQVLDALVAGTPIDASLTGSPLHTANAFGLLSLLVWIILPISLGYLRFIQAEIE